MATVEPRVESVRQHAVVCKASNFDIRYLNKHHYVEMSHYLSEADILQTFSHYKERCDRTQDLSRKYIWRHSLYRQRPAKLPHLLHLQKDFQEDLQMEATVEQRLHIPHFKEGKKNPF